MNEWDSESDLKHQVKLLKGWLRPVRDYRDPFSDTDPNRQIYSRYSDRWPQIEFWVGNIVEVD